MEDDSVQIMSREIVKPSSEIQNDHPKTLKLSYLDQLSSPFYVHIIFFYQANEFISISNQAQISRKLKLSLSHTLATFYPLAGRVNGEDKTVIHCNDAGVEFIEARVHTQLTDALKSLDEDVEDKSKLQYIPIDVANYKYGLTEKPFLFLQITFFDCGGISLGISFSHVVADCSSIMMFINAWASQCRSESEGIPRMVSFDLATHFPTRELPDHIGFRAPDKKMIRTKMLVFDKEKIALLKKDAVSSTVKDPTRVEVISALIWKFMMQIKTEPITVLHPVNLRGRKRLLENVFGNCLFRVLTTTACADVEFDGLVEKLRRSLRKIDDDYITESQDGDNYMNYAYRMHCDHMREEICNISSWCRFPFYEVDYGFGKPILFYPVGIHNNVIILVSSKTGEDIQAWVTMEQHILEMLQNKINLISTTSTA